MPKPQEQSAPPVIGIVEAGAKYFGLSRSASYLAAQRGDFPVIKIGKRMFVSVVALERIIAEGGERLGQPQRERQ